jgi:multiple sugar transport system permease protein
MSFSKYNPRDTIDGVRSRISAASVNAFEQAMSLPSFLYVMLVIGFPTVYLIYLAVMENVAGLISQPEFVGLAHITAVLSDQAFWVYFLNTIIYAVAVVFGGLLISLGITLALNVDLPYRRFWQTLVILPWAVPFVLSTLMWKLMFNPQFGLINYLLIEIGLINAPINWFAGQWTAFFTVIITTIWINTPLSVLILLAGLQNIPDRMYEAARLDGAGVLNRFRHVTLPLLRPAIVTVLLIQSLLALRGFDIIFAMTGGGPGTATTVIAIDIYNNLIQYGNIGYAAAEGLVLIVIVLLALGLLLKFLSTDQEVDI